jgi:AraC-like DNA-binding protein
VSLATADVLLNMRTAYHDPERDSPWYLEVPPSPDLAPWISHFRIIRTPAPAGAAPAVLRLLADGCSGVVIDCGPSALSPLPLFMGVMQVATVVTLAESREIIGVRFTPTGALAFVSSPLREFTGRRVPLPLLWGGLAQQMGAAVRSATFRQRVPALESCFRAQLRQRRLAARSRGAISAQEVQLVSLAIAHLGRNTAARVSDVAEVLGVGERKLERAFNRAVGIPPKVYHRIRRCYEAARLIRRACGDRLHMAVRRSVAQCNWSAIGSDAGYADQAHFIREFRALTGVTPVAYAREHHPVGFIQYDGGRAS